MEIFIVGSGSGGHIFPAFSLAYELEKRLPSLKTIFFVSGKREEKIIIDYIRNKLANLKILILPISLPKKRGFFDLIKFFISLIKGTVFSFFLLLLLRPQVIVGFGGLLSLPLILGGFILRIPTVIHEQNVYPGKANRFLSYFANKVALSFEESKKYFRRKKNLIVSGNPLRPDLKIIKREEALKALGLYPELFTILVLGGSQGARNINFHLMNLWGRLKEDLQFQVIHLTGLKDFTWVKEKYKSIGIPAKIFPFYEELGFLYSASDLIVTRGGASTLNEISYFSKPAIVIPYPYVEAHQVLNAHYYAQRGALICLEEKEISEKLYPYLIEIIRDRERQRLFSERIKRLNNPFSVKLLADLIEGLLDDKGF